MGLLLQYLRKCCLWIYLYCVCVIWRIISRYPQRMDDLPFCDNNVATCACDTLDSVILQLCTGLACMYTHNNNFRSRAVNLMIVIGHGRRLGGRKKLSRKKFSNDLLGKNVHFNAENFWWPFFSHRPSFAVSTSLLSEVLYIPYMTLFLPKNPLFHF